MVHCSSGVDPAATAAEAMGGGRGDRRGQLRPLLRLVAYISMLPRARLAGLAGGGEKARKVLKARRGAVEKGKGSGHDPTKMRLGGAAAKRYVPPKATDPLWELVG